MKITVCHRAGRLAAALRHHSTAALPDTHYQLVIVGGGSGGLAMAAQLAPQIRAQGGRICLIEPRETHFYQPYWTLVGGGVVRNANSSGRVLSALLPKGVDWVYEKAAELVPSGNYVITGSDKKIKYDVLIVAAGLQLDFTKIRGLPDAFYTPGVCSNYAIDTVGKTFPAIQQTQEGNAIFTQPPNPIKCAGAPQKIMYLADANFRKRGVRDRVNVVFNTALGVIFSAPKYAATLTSVAAKKSITVNYKHNLVEVNPGRREAVFQHMDSKETITMPYSMIHITPPMSAPDLVKSNSQLADPTGFLNVDRRTLQHVSCPNVFGIGDCTNLPTSKTAAAVAGQSGVLYRNILAFLNGKPLAAEYAGYTSCPLVTGFHKGVLAEFDYDLQPLETFPFDQGKERTSMYFLKKDMMPFLYWNLFLRYVW
ncbi:SQRDL [Cordylochernes scorpioides]|uniref:SQRDL n=1 Tax=Cordylochernes scorpioides TaxID=51811 RepID=A0ABY6KE51_9ARAC|nr:SQRDL [Cordylochernes scorpioides]